MEEILWVPPARSHQPHKKAKQLVHNLKKSEGECLPLRQTADLLPPSCHNSRTQKTWDPPPLGQLLGGTNDHVCPSCHTPEPGNLPSTTAGFPGEGPGERQPTPLRPGAGPRPPLCPDRALLANFRISGSTGIPAALNGAAPL